MRAHNAVFWGAGAPAKASQQRGLLRCDNNTLLQLAPFVALCYIPQYADLRRM
ncbi:hypothetical protein Q7C_1479 [Methylophaga frappieri]|uniref:Uncharacterized protein n=1 Tax=Methylophaga frappieri (strain ATCC BAA-2434 / DSM 25690 / JAM7) TaxID=754477 RepID=I1YI85_METFJ|nr:hypothetical protein Q7C_1479 [Methylophaga frappieri]